MKKAVKIYKRGVELGSVEAMRRLGDMHDTGSGVKLDKKKASQLYRMAADRGMAKAQYSLANNVRVEARFEEAVAFYRAAAAQGFTFAEHSLGACYMKGEGVEKDLDECRRWWMLAAAKGHGAAMANIGALYHQGVGVEFDLDEARRWYDRAAAAGKPPSAVFLRDLDARIAARTAHV